MMLDIPDFACMLPAECSFSESVADEAVDAPTPHTPVVLSIFEGEGLEVGSARVQQLSGHSSNSSSSRHARGDGFVEDEFDFSFDMPEAGAADNCMFIDSRPYQLQDDLTLVQVKDHLM
eukprot:gene10812-10968_t